MDETEVELDRERFNSDRLAAALRTVLTFLRRDDLDELRAGIVGPPDNQLCVGHVIDGALALHEQVVAARPQ